MKFVVGGVATEAYIFVWIFVIEVKSHDCAA
jgi:hypothetical protein